MGDLCMKLFYSFKVSYVLLFSSLGISLFAVCCIFGAMHAATAASAAPQTMTIVLDAGHGGEDGGAVGVEGRLEKDINLSIALNIRDMLTDAGCVVKMIRDSDVSVGDSSLNSVAERKRSDIHKRVSIVNETENCILISIHQNYFAESQYNGAQMFYSDNDSNSQFLAESIRKCIQSELQPENHRENKTADGIYLLEHVSVPAVIVECGFISNPDEAAMLADSEYQRLMAAAITHGIIQYCGMHKESSSV